MPLSIPLPVFSKAGNETQPVCDSPPTLATMPRHAAPIFDRPARPPRFTLLSHRFSPALSTAKDDLNHKFDTVSESETFFR